MPQSNRRIAEVDLRGDMRNYYRNSVATYLKPCKDGSVERLAALVCDYHNNGSELEVEIQVLPKDGRWSSRIVVPNEAMSYDMPHLGSVKCGDHWVHLSRNPARRMRKGYNDETVFWYPLEDDNSHDFHTGCLEDSIVKQIWYGSEERLHNNVVLWNKGIYYKAEKVATVDDTGSILFIPNKEKLGEFVCKLLASNWDAIKSLHSNLTLPS